MSDIYYCSNNKNKQKSSADGKSSSAEKSSKSGSANGVSNSNSNNNNNNNTTRENNNVCGKHISNGKTNWNAKGVQSNPSGHRDSTGNGLNAQAQPQKVYHNARCARHHKPHHNHSHNSNNNNSSNHNSSSNNTNSIANGNNNNNNSNSNGVLANGATPNGLTDLCHHQLANPPAHGHGHNHTHTNGGGHRRKSESVLSTDSDIRFTRRKLGDSQKCGCAVIAGFLVALLVAGAFVYVGYTYFRPEPLPDRTFRGKFLVMNDKWSMELADQNSLRFNHKARDFRERINLIVKRSDLREAYEGSEILALDGTEDINEVVVHFNLIFDPYAGLVSTADLLALFAEEINEPNRKYFANMTVDPQSLTIKEVTGLIEEPVMSSSPLGGEDDTTEIITTTPKPPRRCEPLKLNYCRSIGYNITTYPNFLGHHSFEEVQADVIAFRELVDAECFREAFDFVCRLLQPPCDTHGSFEPTPGMMCREYCQLFMRGCGSRLPARFKRFFDCETFPESTGIQSCHNKPHCAHDLQNNAQSPRLCDGFVDCPDFSDERTCTFCTANSLYCGRGRACVPRKARCDGKADCPDGSDEKDCLAIAPLAADLLKPEPMVPYLPRFHSEGFAVFSEKGVVGKLCAEGLEADSKLIVRQTVAESLCKSLGYESVEIFEVRNDTEQVEDYVRVLDPHAPEISFIRTHCQKRQVLYVGCGELQCGVQSVLSPKQYLSLPKMSSPGDWPWLVALYREDIHVCDGTLISRDWVLTTESCFQGQPRATWMAIFGAVRLSSNAPWTQRRRIIGLIKSPVEGSTAALIRLETPVNFSDHVRPICLPDELQRKQDQLAKRRAFVPKAERLEGKRPQPKVPPTPSAVQRHLAESQKFFVSPAVEQEPVDTHSSSSSESREEYSRYDFDHSEAAASQMPHAEALTQTVEQQFNEYPLPDSAPQVHYYSGAASSAGRYAPVPVATGGVGVAGRTPIGGVNSKTSTPPPRVEEIWTNCNTLGWSRQRDHLQRVQLKIGDMAPCENISIATVNSMCTEATYQKHDCTQEEYSGAPVQCLIPGTNQWALLGVSSWRIACGPSGVERPRMYDKITSNAAWIREILSAA
ncbi:uncharacterized protein LOC120773922 [Bactrocera tryoni]|uniref:uncharacterized protein LOC120773922 n=1 Tax=Bactrocera tryoni TaxID=59916 RepID=UPI001A9845CA|nr:uncharacterized protein LOC120773922 [Bactrocera tryoni]